MQKRGIQKQKKLIIHRKYESKYNCVRYIDSNIKKLNITLDDMFNYYDVLMERPDNESKKRLSSNEIIENSTPTSTMEDNKKYIVDIHAFCIEHYLGANSIFEGTYNQLSVEENTTLRKTLELFISEKERTHREVLKFIVNVIETMLE